MFRFVRTSRKGSFVVPYLVVGLLIAAAWAAVGPAAAGLPRVLAAGGALFLVLAAAARKTVERGE